MPYSSLPSAELAPSLFPLADHLAARAALTAWEGLRDTISGINNHTLATTTDSDTADSLSHLLSSLTLAQRAALPPALANYLSARASLTAREALRDAITGVNNRTLATTTDSETANSLSHLLSSLTLAQRAAVLPALANYLSARASLTAWERLLDTITSVNNRLLATMTDSDTTDSLSHLPSPPPTYDVSMERQDPPAPPQTAARPGPGSPPSYEEATASQNPATPSPAAAQQAARRLPSYEESIARQNPAAPPQTAARPGPGSPPSYEEATASQNPAAPSPATAQPTASRPPSYEESIARQNPAPPFQTVGQPELEPPPAYEPGPSTLRLELGDTPTQSDA